MAVVRTICAVFLPFFVRSSFQEDSFIVWVRFLKERHLVFLFMCATKGSVFGFDLRVFCPVFVGGRLCVTIFLSFGVVAERLCFLLFLSERFLYLLCYWFYWTRLSQSGLVYTNTYTHPLESNLRGSLGGKLFMFVLLCFIWCNSFEK